MSGRLIPAPGESFRAQCDCSGEWIDLLGVDDAAEGFWSWNLRHSWGGLILTCQGCSRSYSLGGAIRGEGLPDLIEVEELNQIPRLEMSRVQLRLLDVSLTAEDCLWVKGMEFVKQANEQGDPERAIALKIAATLLRGTCQREKRATMRAILDELGVEPNLPAQLRIARRPDGGGVVYSVDRGPLPMRAKVAEPELVRELDLTESDLARRSKLYDWEAVDRLAQIDRFSVLDLD